MSGAGTKHRVDYNGLQLINREVIIRYLCRLLEIDRELAPFRINDVETSVYTLLTITNGAGTRQINVGGRIDRLDQIYDKAAGCQRLRVVDYKTGRYPSKKINTVEEIFSMPIEPDKHADYYLQTMLYAMIVRHDPRVNPDGCPVSPALLFIQHTAEEGYDPTLLVGKERVADIADIEEEFADRLKSVVSDIFDSQKPFSPTADKSVCGLCPYAGMCGR